MKKLLALVCLLSLCLSCKSANPPVTVLADKDGTLRAPTNFFRANSNLIGAFTILVNTNTGEIFSPINFWTSAQASNAVNALVTIDPGTNGLVWIFNTNQFTTINVTNISIKDGVYITNIVSLGRIYFSPDADHRYSVHASETTNRYGASGILSLINDWHTESSSTPQWVWRAYDPASGDTNVYAFLDRFGFQVQGELVASNLTLGTNIVRAITTFTNIIATTNADNTLGLTAIASGSGTNYSFNTNQFVVNGTNVSIMTGVTVTNLTDTGTLNAGAVIIANNGDFHYDQGTDSFVLSNMFQNTQIVLDSGLSFGGIIRFVLNGGTNLWDWSNEKVTDYATKSYANTQDNTASNGIISRIASSNYMTSAITNYFPPIATPFTFPISNTVLVIEGDSLSTAFAVPADGTWPYYLSNRCSNFTLLTNAATAGDTVTNMINTYATQIAPYKPGAGTNGILFVWAGINDIVGVDNAATVFGNLNTLWTLARSNGFKVCAFTVTLSRQWPQTHQEITDLNNLIRQSTNYDWLVDLGNIPEPGADSGWYIDNVHFSTNGNRCIAEAVANEVSSQSGYRRPAPTFAQSMHLPWNGSTVYGSHTFYNGLIAGASEYIIWNTRTAMYAPLNGYLRFCIGAGTHFYGIYFGQAVATNVMINTTNNIFRITHGADPNGTNTIGGIVVNPVANTNALYGSTAIQKSGYTGAYFDLNGQLNIFYGTNYDRSGNVLFAVIPGTGVTGTTNADGSLTLSTTGGTGASNAVSTIYSNGVVKVTGATEIDFIGAGIAGISVVSNATTKATVTVTATQTNDSSKLPLDGGTMTGPLEFSGGGFVSLSVSNASVLTEGYRGLWYDATGHRIYYGSNGVGVALANYGEGGGSGIASNHATGLWFGGPMTVTNAGYFRTNVTLYGGYTDGSNHEYAINYLTSSNVWNLSLGNIGTFTTPRDWMLSVNGTNRIYVKGSAASVGIGKVPGAYALDVNGTVNATTFQLPSGQYINDSYMLAKGAGVIGFMDRTGIASPANGTLRLYRTSGDTTDFDALYFGQQSATNPAIIITDNGSAATTNALLKIGNGTGSIVNAVYDVVNGTNLLNGATAIDGPLTLSAAPNVTLTTLTNNNDGVGTNFILNLAAFSYQYDMTNHCNFVHATNGPAAGFARHMDITIINNSGANYDVRVPTGWTNTVYSPAAPLTITNGTQVQMLIKARGGNTPITYRFE